MSTCEFLRIDPTNDQRKAFNSMFAKLVLYRLAKSRKDNPKPASGADSDIDPSDFFADTKNINTSKYDYRKDWTFPQCCNQYFQGPSGTTLFEDFLKEVSKLGDIEINEVNEDSEYTRSVLRLSEQILREETQFPQPILQSIQIGLDMFEFKLSSDLKSNQERMGLVSALTRLFYLPPNSLANPFIESDIKLFQKFYASDASDTYVRNRYTPLYFVTLLSRQNVCPHFSRFSAFLTCTANTSKEVGDCKDWKTGETNIKLLHLYEIPTFSVQAWLTEPSPTSITDISEVQKDNKVWLQFQLQRPLLLEVQNLLYQISFVLYTLSVFNIRFDTSFNKNFTRIFRIYKCKEVQGYDRYRTLRDVFYVPNYGNFLVLSPNFPEIESGSAPKHGLTFVGIDTPDASLRTVLTQIVDEMKTQVDEWNSPEETDKFFNILESPNDEMHTQQPQTAAAPLLVNDKDKITEFLAKFTEALTKITERTTTSYEFYQDVLSNLFEKFRMTSPGKRDLNDLVLIDDFGFHLDEKIQMPTWLKDTLFPKDETSGLKIDPRKLIATDPIRSSLVDPEVRTISSTLQSLVAYGRYGILLTHLKGLMGQFLKDNGITSSTISDRYTISANQLEARKHLRQYGVSFLSLLARLSQSSGGGGRLTATGLSSYETEQWWNAAKLGDMFNEVTRYLGGLQKSTREALFRILKVEQPQDFRKLLNVLMLLTFLQRMEPKTTTTTSETTTATPLTETKIEKEKREIEEKKNPPLTDEQLFNQFAALFKIDPSELSAHLRWIEEKHGLPDDVRVVLKELIHKINTNATRKVSRNVSQFSQAILAENRKQDKAFSSLSSQENEQDMAPLTIEQLQEEIRKTEMRLQTLKERQKTISL